MNNKLLSNQTLMNEYTNLFMQILLICRRHKRSIDEFDIIEWLNNFEPSDRDDALKLLSMVDYWDDSQIIEGYNERIGHLLEILPKDAIVYTLPIGDFGKSGTSMIYLFRKSQNYSKNKHIFKLTKNERKLKKLKGNEYLLFIDDYFGSGRSAVKYYNHSIKNIVPKEANLHSFWMPLVSQKHAEEYLTKYIPNSKVVSWKTVEKAFRRNRSPFGSYEKMKSIRDMVYRYGSVLEPEAPLGYENTQGFTTFSYGSPNNLLPIFWSSRRNTNGRRWKAIFPRFSKDKIQSSKEYRKQTAYWLGLARSLDSEVATIFATGIGYDEIHDFEFKYIQRIDFRLFALIRLKRQGRPLTVIYQILGIVESDYKEIVQEGIRRQLLDRNGNLSHYGEECYKNICRKIILFQKENEIESNPNFEKIYVPLSFRGIT